MARSWFLCFSGSGSFAGVVIGCRCIGMVIERPHFVFVVLDVARSWFLCFSGSGSVADVVIGCRYIGMVLTRSHFFLCSTLRVACSYVSVAQVPSLMQSLGADVFLMFSSSAWRVAGSYVAVAQVPSPM